MGIKAGSLFLVFLWSVNLWADIPTWAKKNSTKKQGQVLTTACEGTGPSASLARREAISGCQITARQFLDSEVKIKSLSVETESAVGFHQEIEEMGSIRNLTCEPRREEIFEKDGQYRVWVECRFDLNKAQVNKPEKTGDETPALSQIVGLSSVKPTDATTIEQDHKILFLETVPQCKSVIIRGQKPRTVLCETNPLKISLDGSEKEIIVRAKGYRPKTIPIEKGRSNGTLQVFLERN